jgi:ATP-binding cassette subfamily F protein uup
MDLRTYLELFLFDPNKQRQKIGALSGGERARVALAKLLRSTSNLLLLDEPTNDLDLPTLAALEELLLRYGGSVLVVTHDRAFLDRVATSVLAFEATESGRAHVEKHGGGWSDYVAHKKELADQKAAKEIAAREALKPKEKAAEPKKKSALTYAERIELEGIMEKIDAAEQAVAKDEAARLTARWEELESKKG